MSITKADVELYLQDFLVLEKHENGWRWGIDNAGGAGDSQYGDTELLDYPDDWRDLRGKTHPTELAATEKGLAYLWACRPDLVAIARNDAISAEKHRAQA